MSRIETRKETKDKTKEERSKKKKTKETKRKEKRKVLESGPGCLENPMQNQANPDKPIRGPGDRTQLGMYRKPTGHHYRKM